MAYTEPEFPPLTLSLSDPSLLLADPDIDQDKNAMIEVYYDYCRKSSEALDLKDYMDMQCACTAAEMSKIMDVGQVRKMFANSRSGDFEYARMMLLAYVPCMAKTAEQLTFDNCYDSTRNVKKKYTYKKMCQCTGKAMREHVLEKGQTYIPGFDRSSFKKSESVNNPFGYMLTRKGYQRKYTHELYVCRLDATE
ncbi:hypothetical protein N9Z27_02075 [Alphaproteobacteria bacterium]|nr:hypothetical protein [Alphaproteobacteria bacterium]